MNNLKWIPIIITFCLIFNLIIIVTLTYKVFAILGLMDLFWFGVFVDFVSVLLILFIYFPSKSRESTYNDKDEESPGKPVSKLETTFYHWKCK